MSQNKPSIASEKLANAADAGSKPSSQAATHASVSAVEPTLAMGLGGSQPAVPYQTAMPSPTEGFARSPSSPETAPQMLGPYQLLTKLGQGGMGAVYKARHTRLDKLVAIKILPSHLTRDSDAVARFEREMKAVGKLDHPGIVRAMDAGEANGTHYLAMELVEGQDCHDYIASRNPLAISTACRIVRQAALALAYAHQHGMVHRDIKPSNLFLSKSGQVKVLDLGLARLAQDGQSQTLTSDGQCFGTPDYMAPEQWEDAHAVDHRCDLYALGCTLFHLLTGRAPYGDEHHRSTVSKMKAHSLKPSPDLIAARADVPAELAAIYTSLMAKDPAERLASATLLAERLAPFCRKAGTDSLVPVAATVPNISSPSSSPSTIMELASSTEATRQPPRRGWPKAIAAASGAAALLLLLGVIVITITNKDGTKTVINVPEGTEADVQVAPGSKVTITQPTTAPEMLSAITGSGWHGWPTDAPAPAIAPFDAAQAKEHQRAWAEYLKLPVEYTNSIGMKFVLIPPGEFTMGSTPEEIETALRDSQGDAHRQMCVNNSGPQHKVTLIQSIYLGIHELTQKQYAAITQTNPSYFSNTGLGNLVVAGLDTENCPVDGVNWMDATTFSNRLSQQESHPPFYLLMQDGKSPAAGNGYRLPTEAEWEFACRAGTSSSFWMGTENSPLMPEIWMVDNSRGMTHSVGQRNANSFGLHDMHGNVWEWVNDLWTPGYYEQFVDNVAINPQGSTSPESQRVIRGGGWDSSVLWCRSSYRVALAPEMEMYSVGFRIALPIEAVGESLKRQGVATGRAAPPSSEAPIDFAVERKAAERLLRLGKGTAWLGNHNRQWLDRGLKEPLPVEPFCIVNGLFPNADLTDDELGVLTGCRAIDHLQLTGNPKLTAAGLMKLGPLPHLLKLEIGGTSIGNETLAGLGNYPSLKELFAIPSPINEAGWASLPACPRLEQLITSFQVGDAGLRRIAEQCPELRQLTLFDWSISDLSPLARLPRLRFLQTGPHALSDAGIDTLLKLPVLDELCVDNADTADLARLPRLAPNLTRLHLRNQATILGTNSEVWASVTQLPRLLELSIDHNIFVDGPALQRIMAMSNLRRFHVYEPGQPPDWMAKFRTFTADDVATFRRQRPDVELVISGQTYPALSDWPGKFEGSTSIAEWSELPPGAPAPAVGTFSPEVAQQHQTAWAEHLKQPVELTNSTGMKFRLIPPSETVSNLGTPEQPRNSLQRIEKPYYLGATEVTVGQFQQFVAATAYQTDAERLHNGHNLQSQPDPNATWKTPGYPISDDLPVNVISPADAQAFCAWLNTQSEIPNLKSEIENRKSLYSLPTELEWELASRAGGAGDYAFANTAQGVLDYAWTSENVAGKPIPVQPVATKRANPFGLHDVLGNVWEYYTNDNGNTRVVAGSGSDVGADTMTIGHRAFGTHSMQANVGFRVLRQLEPSPPAPKFAERPVLTARHTPLGPQATVTRPAPIPGIRSWTIELAAHQSHVTSIAWSPKGDVIATTSADMSVRLWDRDGHLKSILLSHAGELFSHSVSFSPDGSRLATVDGSTDVANPSTLRIWDVSSSLADRSRIRETSDDSAKIELSEVRLLAVVPLRSWGHCVAWSPDGKRIAYGGGFNDDGQTILCQILDVATGQPSSLKVESTLDSLAWSPDSRTLCVREHGLATLFDAASGEKRAALTAPDVEPGDTIFNGAVAWSPDGRWIAGSQGQQVRIWDAESRQHQRTITTEFSSSVHSIAWHKDSQLLAVTGEGGTGTTCFIFDTTTGEVAAKGPTLNAAYDIAWSPDGNEVVIHTGGVLRFIDGKTGKLLRSGPERGQSQLDDQFPSVLASDGKLLRFKNHDAERLEFDGKTGQFLDRRKAPPGWLAAMAPDERWRAYVNLNIPTEVVVEPKRFDRDPVTITTPGSSSIWRSDPSGERIAQAFGQQVQIWEASTGNLLSTLPHPAKLWSFEWSPDGQQIATAADDKTIRLWDTKTIKVTAEFKQFPLELHELNATYSIGGAPILAWTRDGGSLWIPLGASMHAGLLDLTTGRVAPVENFSNGSWGGSLTLASDGDRLLAREGYGWTFLRDRDGSRQLLGQHLGVRPQWHPDSRRFLSGADMFGVRGFDVSTRRRLGTLWPVLTDDHWLCVGPTGHYRGSPGASEQFVYVAQLDDGSNITLSPADFATRFGWKNDPEKATLLKLTDE